MKLTLKYLFAWIVLAGIVSCSPAGGEKRGHEFMPDMVHSTAYEANIYEYYYYNTWGTEDEYKDFVMPRKSVPGTIARGAVGASLSDSPEAMLKAEEAFSGAYTPTSIYQTINGSVPYPYADTDDERIRASQEIVQNPYPITEAGLMQGQQLYNIYCGICHGAQGDGLGYLVREGDPARGVSAGVYPAAPANLIRDVFIDTTEGAFYHSIMYGKNMMGSYADKLSYEERWQVIHYIRSLQAKSVGAQYTESTNTLNNAIPGGPLMAKIAEDKMTMQDTMPAQHGGDGHDAHGGNEGSHGGNGDHQEDH